jgi:hypothetical protein
MRKSTFAEIISSMHYQLENGCSDHSCKYRKPGGQGTNASCRCTIRYFTKEIWWLLEQMEGKTQWEKEDL